MNISKLTFSEGHVWLSVESEDGEYLGTLHSAHLEFIEALKKGMPKKVFFK